MKLIWIHGAPAAGKLTVAKYLNEHYGYKLLHNHLAVDLSLSIYDEFGDKDFSDFTNGIRRTVLAKAKSIGVSHIVMTYMTCAESDSVEINRYLDFFVANDIEVYPIHLCPKVEVILDRSVSEERQQSHKLSCKTTISNLLNDIKFLSINHENTLSIDNSNLTPREVALKIVDFVK